MKCLENLSLVDDECLDDLKKDIEALINSYVDVKQSCVDIFKEIRGYLNHHDVLDITNAFDSDWFFQGPIPINQMYDFEMLLKNIFSYNNNDWDVFACDIQHLWGGENNLSGFDPQKNNYWFYRDGANWQAWMVEHNYFLDEIEEDLVHQEPEQYPEIFRVLRSLKSKYIKCDKK